MGSFLLILSKLAISGEQGLFKKRKEEEEEEERKDDVEVIVFCFNVQMLF